MNFLEKMIKLLSLTGKAQFTNCTCLLKFVNPSSSMNNQDRISPFNVIT